MATTNHIYTNLDFSQDFEVRQQALDALNQQIMAAPIDTQAALVSFACQADPHQQQVIDARARTIRVVAPAGSGKTQTVICRVLYRIREGLAPSRNLVLTFDNAAATSLRDKLREQTEAMSISAGGHPVDLAELTISTLNAFGYGILRKDVRDEWKPVIKPPRPRRLIREVKEALREKSADRYAALPVHLGDRVYLELFSVLKNQLIDPRAPDAQRVADTMLTVDRIRRHLFAEPLDAGLAMKTIQAALWLFMAYELAMQRDRVIDFDDQKLRAYLSLMSNPTLLAVLQGRFSEIVVDEFQDINLLDFEFIRMLAEKCALVVTGDDDQAIYGFRGCTPDFIIDLEHHLGRPVASYELQINYRCPPNIVHHADRLIRLNTRRIPKNPIPFRTTPSEIKVVSSLSAGLEARMIVAFIKRVMRANPSLKQSDFAVLYRTNAQSLPLQVEFILNHLPYSVREEHNILDNEELKRLLGVLRLKLALNSGHPPSTGDRLHTIRAYFRFVQEYELDRLRPLLHEGRDFLSLLSSEELYRILPRARESHLAAAVDEALRAKTLLDTLDVLSKRFKGLSGMVGSLEDVNDEKVPLAEIYEVAANFRGDTRDFVSTIERALEQARLTGAGRDQAGVALLTYFGAKGRQWHTVILTTCNDGLIPHRKAPIEDERRLLYVALSRASSNLLISYVRNACKTKVVPSRFLFEAGLLR